MTKLLWDSFFGVKRQCRQVSVMGWRSITYRRANKAEILSLHVGFLAVTYSSTKEHVIVVYREREKLKLINK